jgi:ABC-type polysaccharide/polyol phosphate transport system ATPase subunit
MIDIKLDRVSKYYKLRSAGNVPKTWHSTFARRRSRPMWALRDVSFQVEQGEALGIVGHNGAGKTTILRILSSITTPTDGEITVRGRLAALVEVGSGFHPELTGRENIDLHGAMLGMRSSEIRRKLDSIIDFAGVDQYIDVPVKRYSSGMYVRLGFSIAAHLDPDILLLDEVLAVGDFAFQTKCLDRIAELRRAGRTIIFISHDLAAVYRLCDRALLLHHGHVAAEGPPRQVIDQYQQMTFSADPDSCGLPEHKSPAQCTGISFLAPDSSAGARTGHPMVARLSYRLRQSLPGVVFRVSLYWPSGYLCAQLTTDSSQGGVNLDPGEGIVEFHCPVLPVVPGLYRVDLSIESNGQEIDLRQRCATLNVAPGKQSSGDFYIENSWKLIEGSTPDEMSRR